MSSAVQICNIALTTHLGAQTITSLSEGTPASVQCSLHYDTSRRRLLEMYWWSFATTRYVLPELTNDRDEWLYRYVLPPDSLEVRYVTDDFEVAREQMAKNLDRDTPREISKDSIYTNVQNAKCEYTFDVEDTTLMPQYFQDALSAMIAARISMAITQDTIITLAARADAQEFMDSAVAADEGRREPRSYDGVADYHAIRGVQ